MVKEAWPSITLIRSFNHLVSSNLNTVYPMGDNDRINVKLACFERDPHTKSALQIQSTNAYKLGSINIINSKKQKKFLQIAKKKKKKSKTNSRFEDPMQMRPISGPDFGSGSGNYKQRRESAADLGFCGSYMDEIWC